MVVRQLVDGLVGIMTTVALGPKFSMARGNGRYVAHSRMQVDSAGDVPSGPAGDEYGEDQEGDDAERGQQEQPGPAFDAGPGAEAPSPVPGLAVAVRLHQQTAVNISMG
ncbi:hypothetical protein [Nonomuraea sp. KM88]|uniref:hypothetical protein n=1 Tax=Nonomuraea sp. KM88 TaxID=3457427 RepID=UPI003FCCE63F